MIIPPPGSASGPALRAAFVLAALLIGAVLLWRLTDVLVIIFGAILVANVLGMAAETTERITPLRGAWAKAVSWLLMALLIGGFIFLLGTQIQEQFRNLVVEIPGMIRNLGNLLGIDNLQDELRQRLASIARQDGLVTDVANLTTVLIGMAGTLVLVLFAGLFLALDPESYRRGLLLLVPDAIHDSVDQAMTDAGHALRRWLIGTLIAMLVVGVVTTVALYAIGLPSALALGIIAGMLEFVPFIGPILSLVPALLVAVPEGYAVVAWVGVIYFAIQQIEGNVLVPFIQHRTTDLPPALGILSIVVATLLFGLPGVLLAVPLTIVLIVFVKQLYVRDILGRETVMPGAPRPKDEKDDPASDDGPTKTPQRGAR